MLIATQGSEYKYAVVDEVVNHLRPKAIYVKVTDISFLPEENADDWKAIVIIHTWEYSKPPAEVTTFLDSNYDPTKVLVITTSGSGEEQMDRIDAITGASKMEDVRGDVDRVVKWLEEVLTGKLQYP